jgi:hypothetical protein
MKGERKRSSYSLVRGDFFGVADVDAEDDLDGALGAHHRDLRGRPSVVDAAAINPP